LGEKTSVLRGAPLPAGVDTVLLSRDEVAGILDAANAADWPGDEVERYAEALIAMGLWPADRELSVALLSVNADEVGGFYLHRDRHVYIVAEPRMSYSVRGGEAPHDLGREFVVAHELIHAHQHATHPDLIEFFINWHSQDDAANAVSAALEGEALRAAIEVVAASDDLPTPEIVAKYFGAEPTGDLAEMPALIRMTHAFPYVRGYPLAYREGMAVLDGAPASTEQVMHAEQREADFEAIDLSGLAPHLPAECEVVYENTLGELGISIMFDELTTDPSADIWTGWDGDRYLAARCGEERALFWVTSWDTEADAYIFAQAYSAVAPAVKKRAGYEESPRVYLTDKEVVVASRMLRDTVPHAKTSTRRARVATLAELRSHFGGE
jgi:hypothetical protein